jgi:8-oxo-dGTP pyrophosphatase MutT (NUDIX family)
MEARMGYVEQIRPLIGSRVLILLTTQVVITNRKGHVLLVRRRDDATWALPGGVAEPAESVEEAAMREVTEETGLRLADIRLLGFRSGAECFYRYPNGDQVAGAVFAFHSREYAGELLTSSSETTDARFFSADGFPEPLHPAVRKVLSLLG